jgi:hypothetical protein
MCVGDSSEEDVISLAALLKNLCFASSITLLSLVLCTNMCFYVSHGLTHTCALQNYTIAAHIAG